MKLLFDENLSPSLVPRLADLHPGSVHVHMIGLGSTDDRYIWQYAAENGLTIVSKDSDMHLRSRSRGHPPKVIWLRIGNCSTADVEALLRRHHADLLAFEQDDVAASLVLG